MNKTEISLFKEKAMQWAASFEVCCCLDSNHYHDPYSQYDCLIAVGAAQELKENAGEAFAKLKSFYEQHHEWMFGLLSYELKNEIENLNTTHTDQLGFPDLFFFVPEYLIAIQGTSIQILKGNPQVIDLIHQFKLHPVDDIPGLTIESKFDRSSYIETINLLQSHIKRGDIYEINFCQEFFASHAAINPIAIYHTLNKVSPTPFSGFFKLYDQYILSATPERFLCKRGSRLISQPIKGTAKRSKDEAEDEQIKVALKSSIKEQAENVMIVDLVRNDLTKSAVQGTVKVDELFGIYSFPQVHQMISTISCELRSDIHFIDAIKNTFPMGSMTGAPKIRAMELIDQYEKSKRGAFSGSFGCISPDGDFDFNVIIRSILYHAKQQYLSFQVGGAITYAASAEEEYEECLLKASAIMKVLGK
ncbi:anthranilate synthase component I family protein [Pedobacter sp. Hv1]|uniref:anthranilate synthase component I family protein n=1 Tax=Pedobacter sp. Hv1 TaxID=1740090 RepID=UPI0006D89C0F|nr:anthranilate synthase component I family protein [Pedobacter sp. Hv1]KQB99097.1 aminobenzoate synthetase [Pedobacter sp. Hv1]